MEIYLIAPKPNYQTGRHVLETSLNSGAKFALTAAAALPTVASLLGDDFTYRLCDEEQEDVDLFYQAEVIGISINVAQAARGIELARHFKAQGRMVILGGPHVSLSPKTFEGLADAIVVGELETIAHEIEKDIKARTLRPRYDGGQADLAQSPVPRWDLYNNDRALVGIIQTSRGCPFECNFCDVIQYLGRKQRHKPVDKVVAEAQVLYDHGYRTISLSDDNFTVNRRKSRALLNGLASWNGRAGRAPVMFQTQASIDLARDEETVALCKDAGLREVFIGIETNSEDALNESGKRQNLKRDLVADVSQIVSSGVVVTAGMMVGFDSDDLNCFERQFDFGMALPVVTLRVSVLVAPVATPLFDRMKREGRLWAENPEAEFSGGSLWSNIEPKNMTRAQLAEGATWLVDALSTPDNVIRRFEHMASLLAPAPEHLLRYVPSTRRSALTFGAGPIIRAASRAPGTSRVIDAVTELSRARPEIARDLSTALFHYLNAETSRKMGIGTQ